MVRVAGLKNQVDAGINDPGPDGMTPQRQMDAIRQRVKDLIIAAQACRRKLFAALDNTAGRSHPQL